MPTQQPWNINIHYNALVDAQVPANAQQVLDVGCGDGFLAARLAGRIPRVVALDIDEPVLQRAAARFPDAAVQWMHGDVMTTDLPDFDAVVSNAALHHIDDTRAALARLAGLLRPGGTLTVVTFVKPSVPEGLWHVTSWIACGAVNQIRGKWEHTAPIKWPPPDTFAQLRAHVRAVLPGARVRRLLYGRVLISWRSTAAA
ncbi:SAM-dependent methyltransferase [Mycobacterium paragordonae]|uniref:Methyltransferase n=1 Tax=Mycobacterium paragordonae TaxID=1389713 RepID=A0ABQ1CED3_9MYCO|nr:class I SAM-dependent methyltransferase [Mycobacterium paragordonae]AYE93677.1 SAM-dependent methyltransferase [Mycobacterium paragordonae]GFG82595.1 putative methyltransferase [Mycobacterium paragordonae]